MDLARPSVCKSRETNPDRNQRFEHINATAAALLRRKQPVVSKRCSVSMGPVPAVRNPGDCVVGTDEVHGAY
jgi:hypothetical protein